MQKKPHQNAGNGFSWGACPRTPLEVLAPSVRVGRIRVRPPPPQISKSVRLCIYLTVNISLHSQSYVYSFNHC